MAVDNFEVFATAWLRSMSQFGRSCTRATSEPGYGYFDTARRASFWEDSTRRAAGTQGGFLVPRKNSKSHLANMQRVLRAKIGDVIQDTGRRQFQGFKARVVVKVGERTDTRAVWFKDMLLNEIGESNAEKEYDD